VAEARRATELKPDHAVAYMFWGLALKNLGEPAAAIPPLRTGLGIRPEQFDLHLGLGQCLAATGDPAGAEASLKTAQQLKPDDPRPAQELARLRGR
jgi:Flp pilus assembly protein TadD